MSDVDLNEYASWPTSAKEQEVLAGEVFGRCLVYSHDYWLKLSRSMLYDNYQDKSPPEDMKELFAWIANASEEDRKNAFTLVRRITSGVVFSILNNIDGSSGRHMSDCDSQIHLTLDLYQEEYELDERGEQIASIPINAQEDAELHDRWYKWLAKYSEFK